MNQTNQTWLGGFDGTGGITASTSRTVADESDVDQTDVWVLYGHLHENAGTERIPVQSQPFSVGRHPENTVSIRNCTVSGHHAEILMAGKELLVRDRNSTNGTLLNGRPLRTVEVLRDGDILHFGSVMFTVNKEDALAQSATVTSDAAGDAIAQVQFNTLMSRPGIRPYFQPIVKLDSLERIGFEVLSRSHFIGLETPAKMFKVAAQRASEAALSRVCRLEGMRASVKISPDMQLYLNTHPVELNDPDLIDSVRDLRRRHPTASIVLEVHESSVTSVAFLQQLRQDLNELEIGLAYDDFGAGQARLTELIEVPPDVLKFDIKLVQGLATATESRRSTIRGLIGIVKDLNVVPLAEGVETPEEADICREMGFELAQGYLFGKAEPPAKWITPPSTD